MKHLSLIASAVAVLGLTACEKGLDVGEDGMSPDVRQVKNSLLQVRTRGGGSASDEATVAYPVTVYVFAGDECQAAQTIGDEEQTLNIALTEGAYSVYAIGGASTEDGKGQSPDITVGENDNLCSFYMIFKWIF